MDVKEYLGGMEISKKRAFYNLHKIGGKYE